MLQPGLIMDRPLLISGLIEHAAAQFGDVEIVSRETHGPLFRYTRAQCAARAHKLAHAIRRLGLRTGNAAATLAWNNHRHLEIYYAVSGIGMVIHTCNPRLHLEQLIYIVNHAEDRVLFFDRTFARLIERIAVGGSAIPLALIGNFADEYAVEVRHGWGMTETVAVATMSCLSARQMNAPAPARHAVSAKHGKSAFGVEIKIVDEAGAPLPRDGISQGELMVRGQWIIERYYKSDASALVDGWFPTGDIAIIDPHGTVQIRDRAKDLIKTGGEWISSIDLENAAIGHPAVAMAAVIGVKHPRWEERPLLFIVRKPEHSLEREEILEFLAGQVVKWWVPDEVIFLDSLPVGGTGKIQKAALRERYGSVFILGSG